MKNKWCYHTWSPWRGGPLSRTSLVATRNWNEPVKWNRFAANKSCGFCSFEESDGELLKQCRRCAKKPRVFPSLCDWLDDEVPADWLARLLGLIQDTPSLDWLLLTKRPELWQTRLAKAQSILPAAIAVDDLIDRWLSDTPPANVWIGVSVEDQQRADERIPELIKTPAKVRFLSVEPLLGPVNIMRWVSRANCPECGGHAVQRSGVGFDHERRCQEHGSFDPDERACIHWVIVGGESGPGARPCNVAWIRDIVRQCRSAGVPVFVKQLGANVLDRNDRGFEGDSGPSGWPMDTSTSETSEPGEYQGKLIRVRLRHPKGGDPDEWPEDLRVRQMPEVKP